MSTVKIKVEKYGEERANAVLDCEVVKENAKTVWVKLPNGNRVKRHKTKHLVAGQS